MYDINSDLRVMPDYSAAELDDFLAGTPMHGMGGSFYRWGHEYGINPVYPMCVGILESGWGRSYFASQRNNYFGYEAFDADPNKAGGFTSADGAVQFICCFLANSYLHEPNNQTYMLPPTEVNKPNQYSYFGQFYGGSPTLAGVYKKYATAPHAPYSIASLMNQFVEHVHRPAGLPAVVVSQPLPQEANVDQYTVQTGDSLWHIADKVYGNPYKWTDLAAANAIQGPSYVITPGENLRLPGRERPVDPGSGSVSPVPDQSGRTYQTVEGDNLWNIAVRFYDDGTKYQAIFDANRDKISNPSVIQPNMVLRIP